jgi:hypothetical protein
MALTFVVLALSVCGAVLVPFSGLSGFIKNLLVCIVGLSVLILLGAVAGKVLHDFLLEMN